MTQRMPLPLTVSCFSKIQIGFTFLVPAHLGSPGQRAVKHVCVYACVRVCEYLCLSPTRLAWMSSLVWLAGAGPMYYQQQQPPAEPPAPAAPPGRRERRIIEIIDPRTGVNIIPDHRDSSVAEMKPLKNEVVAL